MKTSEDKRILRGGAGTAPALVMLLMLSLCISFLLLAGGCSNPSETRNTKILFTVTDTEEPFRASLTDAIEKEAQVQGVDLEVRYAGGSVDAQTDEVLAANREGFDAVICFPVDPSQMLEVEEAAGDLPIVFINNMPPLTVLTRSHYMYVGCEETTAGRMQAEYIWNKIGRPRHMKAMLFKGEPGHSGTIGRSSAVKSYFKEMKVDVDWVYEDYAYWNRDLAAEKFKSFLERGIKVDAVFSNNDTMALGILSIMKEYDIDPSEIPVAGVDATQEGCHSIKAGELAFTVFQNGKAEGGTAVKLAKKLVEDGTADGFEGVGGKERSVMIPYEAVDRSNVDQYIEGDTDGQ